MLFAFPFLKRSQPLTGQLLGLGYLGGCHFLGNVGAVLEGILIPLGL